MAKKKAQRVEKGEETPRPAHQFAPTWMGWLGACLSTGLVLGVLLAGTLISRGYAVATLQEQLRQTVEQPGGALLALESSAYTPLFRTGAKQVRDWKAVIDMVTRRQHDPALKLISSKAFTRDSSAVRLQNLLEQLTELESAESERDQQRQSLASRRETAFAAFEAVRSGLDAQLRNQPAESASEPSSAPAPGAAADESEETEGDRPAVSMVYQSGFLQGLPILEGIPDGIADLKALAVYYPLYAKPEKHRDAALLNALSTLRDDAAVAVEGCRTADQALIEFDNESAEKKLEMKRLAAEAMDSTREAVLALGNPKVDTRVQTAYARARTLVQQYLKKDLPALRTA